MNNHYLDILNYLSPNQLEHLYNRNLNAEINHAILKLRRIKLIESLSVTEEQIVYKLEEIKLIERKKDEVKIIKLTEDLITETRDSLEAAQYVVHGCNVIYDENRKVYLIKNSKNK